MVITANVFNLILKNLDRFREEVGFYFLNENVFNENLNHYFKIELIYDNFFWFQHVNKHSI